MKQTILGIKKQGLPHVTSGSAGSVDEFIEKIVKSQFEHIDVIRTTHNTLMDYIDREDAIFVLRLYGNDPRKNYYNLRRGFLTHYPDGKEMVFCDNTFAMPFAALKLAGKSYTTTELLNYMKDSSSRFGFGLTKEERELAYYNWNKNEANINLNQGGWYLAHILPVGKDYSGMNVRDLFPNPNREEWKGSKDHIRRAHNILTDEELSMLKAHFLRMVHPLNSFLVPKPKLVAYNGDNIGEETELISLVQEYIKTKFPEEYKELSQVLQANPNGNIFLNDSEESIGTIIWNDSEYFIKKEKSKIKTDHKKVYNPEKIMEMDIYDQDEEEKLANTLNSIGKSVFLKLYPLVNSGQEISLKEIYRYYHEYAKYSLKTQNSRLSSTRSILNQGLAYEALSNISLSSRLCEADRKKAKQFIADLENSKQLI